jgi:putative DNA methylase
VTDRSKRKLIEVALPLEAINVASAKEKSPFIKRHPRAMHVWWARRPLAACRAVVFASLVDDPSTDPDRFPTANAVEEERTRLFGIVERLVLWENMTNEEVLEEARVEIRRSTGSDPPPLLDPFCGGGSIPLEAQRLGLTAYASDLNPVAVLITKALIEIPPKFANRPPVHPDARRGVGASGTWRGAAGLAEDVRRYGAWMRDEAERRIGHLYPKVPLPREQGGGEATVVAWLWARTVTCPNPACRARMPLVRSFALSTKEGKQAWVEPVVDRTAKSVSFDVGQGVMETGGWARVQLGTSLANERGKKVQATFRCIVCQVGIAKGEYIDTEANGGRMDAQLMSVIAEGNRGHVYLPPSEEQLRPVIFARQMAEEPGFAARLPTETARGTFASNAQGRVYGFREFKDYFSARQLVTLMAFSDLVGEARSRVLHDGIQAGLERAGGSLASGAAGALAYADAVATYLGLGLSRITDFSNTIVSWDSGNTNLRQLFARQAIPMSWDYAETNLLAGIVTPVSGFEWAATSLEAVPAGPPGEAVQADARRVSTDRPALVCTDPPYYDNVAYADLSDFFYVWLRRALADIHPSLFATLLTPKEPELVATPYRFGGDRDAASRYFEEGLEEAFARLLAASPREYPVTVFYAFKQAETDDEGAIGALASTGWDTMLEALIGSGFSVVGTWPLRTEQAQRSVAAGANALASSIVLVCRPRAANAGITTRRDLISVLRQELPEAFRTLQHGNIAPVDLAQASIGPGMAVFSRYAKVLETDGAAMSVRSALALINEALDKALSDQEGEFDRRTRWAISWYEQSGLGPGPYGSAETLAMARDVSVDGLVEAGIVESSRGKVRLLDRSEYPDKWDPARDDNVPVWEATQHLIRALLVEGIASAADLLARMGGLGDNCRDLAYRLYPVADGKKWTEEARAYNALIVAWPEMRGGGSSPPLNRPNLGF